MNDLKINHNDGGGRGQEVAFIPNSSLMANTFACLAILFFKWTSSSSCPSLLFYDGPFSGTVDSSIPENVLGASS